MPPEPGTLVMVDPKHGTWLKGCDMGTYKPKGEVRIFGVYGEFKGNPLTIAWWESVLCGYDGLTPEDYANEAGMNKMRAYGTKILLRRDKSQERTAGGVFLPDGHHERSGLATVVSVGPYEPDVNVGMRVCYDPYHLEQTGVAIASGTDETTKIDWELVICSREAINYCLVGAE